MKKRVLAFTIVASMMAALVGCGSGAISNDKITIEKYKGLEVSVEKEKIEVTDEDVEMSIQSTLQTMSTRTPITDRPAQEGDSVTIDYEGKLDGVAFDGGTAQSQSVEIGAGGYVPGFEDGIIGHNVGETFDVPLTFPEDYQSEKLAGKAVVFTMTLQSIEEVTVPELTEELLPQLSETAKTIDEYKEQVKKDLEKSNKETIESNYEVNLENAVWEELIENCVVEKYPEDEIEEFLTYVDTQLGELAAEQDMEAAELFEQYYQMKPETYIKNSIKIRYAIELIAEKEKITLSAKEYEEGLKEYAEEQGATDVEEFEDSIGRETVELWLLQPKVGEFLIDNCKIVPAKAEK